MNGLKIILNFIKRNITFSPVYNKIDCAQMVKWLLDDRLDVRFQLASQIIWGPCDRGLIIMRIGKN